MDVLDKLPMQRLLARLRQPDAAMSREIQRLVRQHAGQIIRGEPMSLEPTRERQLYSRRKYR